MRKFKLIKEYPESPRLGSIAQEHPEPWPKYFVRDGKRMGREEVEGYPEFWQEIVELCVPIGTKFRYRGTGTVYVISRVSEKRVYVDWDKVKEGTYYFIYEANKYFADGTWIEYKEPILTTEDGVEIFDNTEKPWFVHKKTHRLQGDANLIINKSFHPCKSYLYFSTKQAAEEWIRMNKKKYNRNDVLKIIDSCHQNTWYGNKYIEVKTLINLFYGNSIL